MENAQDSQVTPETQATETPEAGTPEVPKEGLSSKFAAIARKQKALEAERAKFKAEQTQSQSELEEYRKWKADQSAPKAKKSPIEALMEHGYSYEDAANFVINDNKPSAEMIAKESETKIEKFLREQKEREKAKEASEKQKLIDDETKAIENFKSQINDFMTKEAETYELTTLHEAQHLVFETIQSHFDQTKAEGKPVVLSMKEAADLVEAYLEDRVDQSNKTKKFQAKLKSADQSSEKGAAVQAFTSKTLSSSTTATSSMAKAPARSDVERFERALAHLGK